MLSLIISSIVFPPFPPLRSLSPDECTVPRELRVFGKEGFNSAHKFKRGLYLASVSHKHQHGRKSKFMSQTRVPKDSQIAVKPLTRTQVFAMMVHFDSLDRFPMLQQGPCHAQWVALLVWLWFACTLPWAVAVLGHMSVVCEWVPPPVAPHA